MGAALQIFRGDSITIPVKVIAPVDTDAVILFAIKKQPDDDATDSTALIKKTLTSDDISATAAHSVTYLLKLEASDTNQTPGNYIGEFEYVNADGEPATYDQFKFSIMPDINRRTS